MKGRISKLKSKKKKKNLSNERRVKPRARPIMRSVEQLAETTCSIIINSHTRRILRTQIETLLKVSECSSRDTAAAFNRIEMSAVEGKFLAMGVSVGA